MKYKLCLTLVLLSLYGMSSAQNDRLRGLQLYNPVYNNPAFTGSDRLVEADVIAYDYLYTSGSWINLMATLPDSKSSFSLTYSGDTYFSSYSLMGSLTRDIGMKGNSLGLGYSYSIISREKMNLSGGIQYNHTLGKYYFEESSIRSVQFGCINTGLKAEYDKYYAGISLGTNPFMRIKSIDDSGGYDYESDLFYLFRTSFVAGTSLGGDRRVNFDPQFAYLYTTAGGHSQFEWYFGGEISLLNTIGFGFTLGNSFSLSAFISILDRVDLRVGIFQELLSDGLTGYNIDFEAPASFVAQLSFKL
jgi:hypothetical protein